VLSYRVVGRFPELACAPPSSASETPRRMHALGEYGLDCHCKKTLPPEGEHSPRFGHIATSCLSSPYRFESVQTRVTRDGPFNRTPKSNNPKMEQLPGRLQLFGVDGRNRRIYAIPTLSRVVVARFSRINPFHALTRFDWRPWAPLLCRRGTIPTRWKIVQRRPRVAGSSSARHRIHCEKPSESRPISRNRKKYWAAAQGEAHGEF